MSESMFSTYWYRVAGLKPVLRDAAVVSRHVYRGQLWYVIRNNLNGRSHRFNAAAYDLIGRMDGRHTVQQIWKNAAKLSFQNPPTQDEVIRLLELLQEADLIRSDVPSNTTELIEQAHGQSRNDWRHRFSNPFSMRFPLFDPDRFLEKWQYVTAPLFSRGALIGWLFIVMAAAVAAVVHWSELTGSLFDKIFSMNNLLVLWLTFPLVKFLHEFGHAFAVKRWGGEVHEMGIMLLALTPIPYIDATASASFPEKRHRIAVAAMGMMAELLLASFALFVWLNVETGLISALAYNVVLIGGVSTLLFNGNPLLRYDGYYMFADLVEIPNLGLRSTRYLGYLIQRYVLGIEAVESPVTAPGERGWFVVYGPVAFCYRIAVLIGLVWLVSDRFFFIGIVVALWGAVSLLLVPAVRSIHHLLENPEMRERRFRLGILAGSVATGIVLLIFALPVPLWTTTEGVVWLPEKSVIRAGVDCEVVEVLTTVDHWVDKDAPLIQGDDPFLNTEIEVIQARLTELYATYNALPMDERVERNMLLEKIDLVREDMRRIQEKMEKLIMRSPVPGKFVLINARNLPGTFVKKGDLLGYILPDRHSTVRTVVSQSNIGLVRERVTGVWVRLAEQPAKTLKAGIERIFPAADLNLPAVALGTAGGGNIPIDTSDPEGLRALESHFQLDLSLPKEAKLPHVGGRVYVRFEHGRMPVAFQWYRSLRQLLLRKFYV